MEQIAELNEDDYAAVEGEHFDCDLPAPHPGLAHSSRDAQAIWTDDPQVLHDAWASAEEAGR